MAEYAMEDLFEEVIFKIGDHRFKLRERTRSLARKAGDISARFDKIEDDDGDEQAMAIWFDLIDAMLEPLGNGNGTRTHAKTLLQKMWEGDKIGADRIISVGQFCQEKLEQRLDPTWRQPSET